MEIKHICDLIDARKEELFALLSELIQINSENHRTHGNEKDLAKHINGLCTDLGLESRMYSPLELEGFENHPDYVPGGHLEDRYNVTACWKGERDENALMLMGHSDTVQIGDLKNWKDDPLSGRIQDGRIYGRGACDDKYALAAALFIIKLLKAENFKPKANLLFSAYVDEEYGGSHGALAAVLAYPCKRIVNMDGKANQIWHCGSGGQEVKYTYRTKEAVDSAKAAALALPLVLEEIESFAEKRREELSLNRFYAGTIIPGTSLRYMGIRAGNNGMDLGTGEVHFVYYTDKSKKEIAQEFAELEERIAQRLLPLGIVGGRFRDATRFFHYVFCEPDSEDIQIMLEAAEETTGKKPLVCGSCLSDLSVISKYGSSRAYGFGAGRNFAEEGGAHQPNEFMECDALVAYTKTIAAYILKILG